MNEDVQREKVARTMVVLPLREGEVISKDDAKEEYLKLMHDLSSLDFLAQDLSSENPFELPHGQWLRRWCSLQVEKATKGNVSALEIQNYFGITDSHMHLYRILPPFIITQGVFPLIGGNDSIDAYTAVTAYERVISQTVRDYEPLVNIDSKTSDEIERDVVSMFDGFQR